MVETRSVRVQRTLNSLRTSQTTHTLPLAAARTVRSAEAVRAHPQSTRLHYLDSFRVLMLLLGIPYHSFLVFQEGAGWMIAAPSGSVALSYAVDAIHSFRMFAFFFVSGLFSSMVLARRDTGTWLKQRSIRLGLPLVVGVIALGLIERGIVGFYRSWAGSGGGIVDSIAVVFASSSAGSWISHRWFLIDLVIYTAILAATLRRAQRAPWRHLTGLLPRSFMFSLVLTCLALAGFGVVALAPFQVLPRTILDGALRLDELFLFTAPFALGVVFGLNTKLLDRATEKPMTLIVAASIAVLTYVLLAHHNGHSAHLLAKVVVLPCGYLATMAFLGVAKQALNKQSAAISSLVDAAFTIYLVHVIFILIICQPLIRFHVAPITAAAVTMLLSFIASYIFYRFIRRSHVMGYLFNGAPFKGRASPAPLHAIRSA